MPLRVVRSIAPEIASVKQRLSKCGSADYRKPMPEAPPRVNRQTRPPTA